VGQKIKCPDCGSYLEVISLDPLELDWAYDETLMDDEEDEFY
jgi:lysine biosynthesis protein LysW